MLVACCSIHDGIRSAKPLITAFNTCSEMGRYTAIPFLCIYTGNILFFFGVMRVSVCLSLLLLLLLPQRT